MTALLAIDGLTVDYGSVRALSDVSVHVDEGEIVSIIGPNGAGKTTLLAAVAGLVAPRSGAVAYRGASVLGAPLEATVRRGIALVPEGRHVFAGLTVMENLRLGATIRTDAAGVEADIERHLERFPILYERRNGAAGLLSGGEQQMLVIVRALLARPSLLMLDEPSLGLAPRIVEDVYAIIAEVRASGVSVLVVEQNAERALRVADRTYVLNGGIVRMQGPAASLRDAPGFEDAYFGLAPAAADA